jgi:hypothetical protein
MKVFQFKVVEITTTNTTILDQFTNQIIKIDHNTSDDYLKVIIDKIDNFDEK